METGKYCSDCKYGDAKISEEPCAFCINGLGDKKNWEPLGEQIKLEKRPTILPQPVPIYEHTDSEIPERIRISFTNGTSAIYDLHTDQPAPQLLESIRIIRKWKTGYQAPAERRRRRR